MNETHGRYSPCVTDEKMEEYWSRISKIKSALASVFNKVIWDGTCEPRYLEWILDECEECLEEEIKDVEVQWEAVINPHQHYQKPVVS